MRLFLAIEIGPVITDAAGVVIDELRRRAGRLAPHARITWVAPERMHLTLRFIGEADEALGRAIHASLERPLNVEPFELTVAGLGAFPASGQPRVLWAGLTGGRDAVLSVESHLASRLAALAPSDAREYHPHLTLARVRDAAGLPARAILHGLEDTVLGTTRVQAVTLFESRLSPKGPTYVPIHHTVFGESSTATGRGGAESRSTAP